MDVEIGGGAGTDPGPVDAAVGVGVGCGVGEASDSLSLSGDSYILFLPLPLPILKLVAVGVVVVLETGRGSLSEILCWPAPYMAVMSSSSSEFSPSPSPSSELSPSSSYAGPVWCERIVPMPSVYSPHPTPTTPAPKSRLSTRIAQLVREFVGWEKRTGGAETKLGLDRFNSSLYVSSNPALIGVVPSGGWTKPSLMWMEPEAEVLARVEVSGMVNGCRSVGWRVVCRVVGVFVRRGMCSLFWGY